MQNSNTSTKYSRRIIHCDMDAFYASVEQRDFPELKGKPVAVGGGKRGVVAASSYEARKFGVFSAMPSITALRKCPHLTIVQPRFTVYKEVSQEIMRIFKRYTPLVEPLSLDEAFLDVSENILGFKSARETALTIKKDIFEQTGLTASIGVSFNKFLAKIASGQNKPDGITVISSKTAQEFVQKLPIEKFFGVGKVTATKMKKLGIYNGTDLLKWTEVNLQNSFGKSGKHFYQMVRLEDYREVKPDRKRKSVGEERTFENDLHSYGVIMMKLNQISMNLESYLKKRELKGRTITLKIKYNDFTQKTRSKTLTSYTNSAQKIKATIKELVDQTPLELPVRLLGISLSNLNNQEEMQAKPNDNKQITLDL